MCTLYVQCILFSLVDKIHAFIDAFSLFISPLIVEVS